MLCTERERNTHIYIHIYIFRDIDRERERKDMMTNMNGWISFAFLMHVDRLILMYAHSMVQDNMEMQWAKLSRPGSA